MEKLVDAMVADEEVMTNIQHDISEHDTLVVSIQALYSTKFIDKILTEGINVPNGLESVTHVLRTKKKVLSQLEVEVKRLRNEIVRLEEVKGIFEDQYSFRN